MNSQKNDPLGKLVKIKLSQIRENPYQPRVIFNKDEICSLSESIKQNGLISPIAVRKVKDGYELVAGERRLRALRLMGAERANCIVVEADEKKSALLSLIENIQRKDLNVFEEAKGILRLMESMKLSQTQTANKLGMSQSAVANKLRVLKLSEDERNMIIENGLTERHARALLKIEDTTLRKKALENIAYRKLNVSQSEKYIDRLLSKSDKGKTKMVFRDLKIFTNTINLAINTMRKSGIDAKTEQKDFEGYIEYVIKIPKPQSMIRKEETENGKNLCIYRASGG